MAYFTIQQGYFFLCSDIPSEEKQKLNDFLFILEESGVGRIIEEAVGRRSETGGRPGYNPYRLFATILYADNKRWNKILERNTSALPSMPEGSWSRWIAI